MYRNLGPLEGTVEHVFQRVKVAIVGKAPIWRIMAFAEKARGAGSGTCPGRPMARADTANGPGPGVRSAISPISAGRVRSTRPFQVGRVRRDRQPLRAPQRAHQARGAPIRYLAVWRLVSGLRARTGIESSPKCYE